MSSGPANLHRNDPFALQRMGRPLELATSPAQDGREITQPNTTLKIMNMIKLAIVATVAAFFAASCCPSAPAPAPAYQAPAK